MGDLQWLLLRKNNSFLIKRDNVQMSKEKGNLMNLNTFKFSGLANAKAVDLSVVDDVIVLSTKRAKRKNSPKSMYTTTNLATSKRNKKMVGANAVQRATAGSHYRSDLSRLKFLSVLNRH